jgi:hypothetical protein
MGKDKFPHKVGLSDECKNDLERAAALANLEGWLNALEVGIEIVKAGAEAYVKGKTGVVFCTPELEACIENNPAFFETLCQEGVIEWLTPFVLGKSTIPPEENQ